MNPELEKFPHGLGRAVDLKSYHFSPFLHTKMYVTLIPRPSLTVRQLFCSDNFENLKKVVPASDLFVHNQKPPGLSPGHCFEKVSPPPFLGPSFPGHPLLFCHL